MPSNARPLPDSATPPQRSVAAACCLLLWVAMLAACALAMATPGAS